MSKAPARGLPRRECSICKTPFSPFNGRQHTCGDEACVRERRRLCGVAWYKRNSAYQIEKALKRKKTCKK
jgi:hypothetical protein